MLSCCIRFEEAVDAARVSVGNHWNRGHFFGLTVKAIEGGDKQEWQREKRETERLLRDRR